MLANVRICRSTRMRRPRRHLDEDEWGRLISLFNGVLPRIVARGCISRSGPLFRCAPIFSRSSASWPG